MVMLAAVLFGGCAPLAKVVFGIDEIKKVDEERIASFFDESREKVSCSQIETTAAQVDSLIRLDLDSTQMQHRAQPVQVLYFDGDSLIFWHINCYTQSGFLSFDWNNHGSFVHFPPSPTVVYDPHHSMTLDRYRAIIPELKTTTRYTVVILWSNMLRKVSRKAVEAVAANIKGRGDCTLLLVNTDRWWVEYLTKQRNRELKNNNSCLPIHNDVVHGS